MIITCPRCATRYFLGAGDIRPPGRHVRCARCQHTWFQEPSEDLPTPIPVPVEEPEQVGPITDRSRMLGPPPEPEDAPDDAPAPETFTGGFGRRQGSDFEPLSAPPEQVVPRAARPSPEHGAARFRGMILLVAGVSMLSLLLVIFFSIPREIARTIPATVSLYTALGIEVNKTGFRMIATQSPEIVNSIPIIVIKGELINETDGELEAPGVRIAVRDRAGKELLNWIVKPDQEMVGPRGKATFSARLESPPPEADSLEVGIAGAEDR
jgi:predicted Zn finger-like uncharacterized protein